MLHPGNVKRLRALGEGAENVDHHRLSFFEGIALRGQMRGEELFAIFCDAPVNAFLLVPVLPHRDFVINDPSQEAHEVTQVSLDDFFLLGVVTGQCANKPRRSAEVNLCHKHLDRDADNLSNAPETV